MRHDPREAPPTKLACPSKLAGHHLTIKNSRFGMFFGCIRWPSCEYSVGAHPDGWPLGVPTDSAGKTARIVAHEAFDQLWKHGPMQRNEAYTWLQTELGMTRAECHIANFDAETCRRVTELCRAAHNRVTAFNRIHSSFAPHTGVNPMKWTTQKLKCAGFDRSFYDRSSGYHNPRCSQCEAVCINGIPCHETGCPNAGGRDDGPKR